MSACVVCVHKGRGHVIPNLLEWPGINCFGLCIVACGLGGFIKPKIYNDNAWLRWACLLLHAKTIYWTVMSYAVLWRMVNETPGDILTLSGHYFWESGVEYSLILSVVPVFTLSNTFRMLFWGNYASQPFVARR